MMDELAELELIRIGGRNENNIRYADDLVLIADLDERLQSLVSRLHEEFRETSLKINKNETEVMVMTNKE